MASDDFNRADSDHLGSAWYEMRSSNVVRSQRATSLGAGSAAYSFYRAYTFVDDQYAQAVCIVPAGSGGFVGVSVRARGQIPHQNGYFILLADTSPSQGLYKLVNGATTLLQSITGITSGDVVRLEIRGTTLQAFVNDIQVGTDEIDASLSSGSPGLYVQNSVAAAVTFALDDWQGGGFPLDWMPANARSGSVRPQVLASGMST